jgi:hypothetical protein
MTPSSFAHSGLEREDRQPGCELTHRSRGLALTMKIYTELPSAATRAAVLSCRR